MSKSTAHKKSTKKLSNKKRLINRGTKKGITKYMAASMLVFMSLMFLGIYGYINYLNQRFTSAMTSSSYSISDDRLPTVVLYQVEDIKADPVVLMGVNYFLFDKNSKKVISYSIPSDIELSSLGRYGNEKLANVFVLGGMNSSNSIDSGADVVSKSLFKIFGFKVDRYLVVDSQFSGEVDSVLHGQKPLNFFLPTTAANYSKHMTTDLKISELYDLYKFAHSLPSDRFYEYPLKDTSEQTLNLIDEEIQELTLDYYLYQEGKSISILNGSNSAGLAGFGSRVVRNLGGRVISVDNAQNSYVESTLIADELDSKTVTLLSHTFGIKNIILKSDASQYPEAEIDRSNITIIFGFDSVNIL